MRTRTTAAAATALMLTLNACSSDTEATPSRSTITPTEATPSPSKTKPSPTPTQAAMKLGQALAWDEPENDLAGTAQVISYEQDVAKSTTSADEEFGTSGYVWAALEIKVCSTKGTFFSSSMPWTLAYADSSRIEPSSSTYEGFPRPAFPIETKLTAGKCVRGKIVYPVPGGQRPTTVVYAPQSDMDPAEWTVPKA